MAVLSFFGNNQKRVVGFSATLYKNVNTMSLQVRCSPPFRMLSRMLWNDAPGKRVLPFTSPKQFRASMTVEAAIVLPLFVCFALALLVPMKMLDAQRNIQTEMEMVCEDLSFYAYMVEDVDVLDENGDIVMKAVYREMIPFCFWSSEGISVETSVKRRGWIGISGKLTADGTGSGSNESDVEMVYVGNSMGRYHKDKNCHYISNDYQAVSVEEAKKMRDAAGHRFTACSSCGNKIKENGTVYITAGGRHYHGDMECRAMVSYVRKVPIAEVQHLGACSYCGGK